MVGPKNNLDLLRLLAAFQVVVGHAVDFLEVDLPVGVDAAYTVFRWFPGVPVFFSISGYLLARSLARNEDLRSYARNRALRIFPGLWACIAGTLVLLALSGLLFDLSPAKLAAFVFAQMTVGQFWAPFPISEYGLGSPNTPNPALWTIRVEIGFYIVLPFLLIGGRWLLKSAKRLDVALAALAVVSFVIYSFLGDPAADESGYPILIRLLANSPAPHIWLFLAGVLLYRYDDRIKPLVTGRLIPMLGLFLAARGVVWLIFEAGQGDGATVPLAALGAANLVLLAPSFAFGFSPSARIRSLHPRNDISYGVYVWHLVLLNAIVHWDLARGWVGAVLVIVGAGVAGKLSWHLVEAPALARKRISSRNAADVGPAVAS